MADTPGPVEPELEQDDTILSTEEKSVSVLASMSEDEKCKYWAEGSLVPLGYRDLRDTDDAGSAKYEEERLGLEDKI
ncbi:uncharacterized protein J4E84_001658 [Alternaria hordeiaustralica]|uniref:uncharacterized protein n=1 Tax=Alternaria hordeiaustralica TaxID=1187925 RepID=UPI0020C2712F|nr:uncharacterized protein J4E84_001658 [Alternaria hordeiaustralica]KAI4695034.1 hypothetical protein J4E84_001658 [Alternaria hordeiaustralica]